jgi:hypothetical protein
VEGVCEDGLQLDEFEEPVGDEKMDAALGPSYAAMQVSGAIKCVEICNNVHGCIAFSVHDMTSACFVTTACNKWISNSNYMTYVRAAVAIDMVETGPHQARKRPISRFLAEQLKQAHDADEGCTYCPPQNPCEQPRLCRAGQCFHNLKLKDGTPCDDGDPFRFGDVCVNGACKSI